MEFSKLSEEQIEARFKRTVFEARFGIDPALRAEYNQYNDPWAQAQWTGWVAALVYMTPSQQD